MLSKDRFSHAGSIMFKALEELSERMSEEQMPEVSLNVIGGFAMMLYEMRTPYDITDIDYVGKTLYKKFNQEADAIGMKYGLGKGWINNDAMLQGTTQDDLEFSTGELHFKPAMKVGPIQINVLIPEDILRLKWIAVDTSLTAVDEGGDFSRVKDLHDIELLMKSLDVTVDDMTSKYENYTLCRDLTPTVIKTYLKNGREGVDKLIEERAATAETERSKSYGKNRPTSSYIQGVLDAAFRGASLWTDGEEKE